MKKERTFLTLLHLFLSFMKIGAFTFGGGYAMIPIIEKEAVEKRKWISQIEILDVITISEMTPGPIAVNAATYVGHRVKGFWGSFFATLGLVIPSFVIIFVISLFYKTFLSWGIIDAAFKGIKLGVIILLFRAAVNLKSKIKFSLLEAILFLVSLIGISLLTFFDISIQINNFHISLSVIAILIGLVFGICFLSKKEREETK